MTPRPAGCAEPSSIGTEVARAAESTQAGWDVHVAISETPSVPALQGAVEYAIAWQAQNPGRQTIVVLITDGVPTMCDLSETSLIAAVARGMTNGSPIRTFVIGVAMAVKEAIAIAIHQGPLAAPSRPRSSRDVALSLNSRPSWTAHSWHQRDEQSIGYLGGEPDRSG